MCIKGNLNKFRLIYLNLKSLKLSYFVPIAAIFVYIPLMTYLYSLQYKDDISNLRFLTYIEMQHIIPFFAVWWILFALREYIEGDGREVLRTYKSSILFDFFAIWLLYIIHAAVLTTVMGVFLGSYFFEFLVILVQSLVFSSVAFALMIICKTIAVPILVCTIYEIFFMFSHYDALQDFNILRPELVYDASVLVLPYVPMLIASLLLIELSGFLFKKRANL